MTSTARGKGAGIAAIATQELQEDSAIGPGGYLAIAGACLVLLLLAVMFVNRRRREEMLNKHVSLEDDDDTYLRDIEGESDVSAPEDMLANDQTMTNQVVTNGMGRHLQRYSPLEMLNKDNVKNLVPAWAFSLGGEKQRGQ